MSIYEIASKTAGLFSSISKNRPFLIDFFIFVLILILAYHSPLKRFYAPFFLNESSEAFMQYVYYLEALRTGASPFWDQHINLATQGAPQSPIFSPVTLVLVAGALLFKVTNIEHLASMFSLASYFIQAAAGFSMYIFLRFLSLGRVAAIIGGIAYSYNFFSSTYGIYHGYYRITALAIVPLLFVVFIKLFSQTRNLFYYLALSGFLLGVCLIGNGDVKPTLVFIPILFLVAYFEGSKTHGWTKTTAILAGIVVIAGLIALPQIYLTYEALKEGVKSTWNQYVPTELLHPDNTLLGFSQNPFSLIAGFLFPQSFFEYYRTNTNLGISISNFGEQRFSFGISFFVLSVIGVFYRTKLHVVWFITFIAFLLYILGSSTPLGPLLGFLSDHGHIRYPTRSAIVIYFLFAIYAAYGVEVLAKRSVSDFYSRWSRGFVVYLLIFLVMMLAAIGFSAYAYHAFEGSPRDSGDLLSDSLALIVSWLFVILLMLFLFFVLLKARGVRVPGYFLRIAGLGALSFFFCALLIFFIFGLLPSPRDLHDLVYKVGGIKLHRESLYVLLALVLGLTAIAAGNRKGRYRELLLVIVLGGMAVLFIKTESSIPDLPVSLRDDPTAVFKKDKEFEVFAYDPGLGYYRIHVPHGIREKLSPELGFQKNVHNYCCRQYADNLRFAFGMDAGPISMEAVQHSIRRNYANPFWQLYNVKYIVDEFKENPSLLPADSRLYKRISENVISLNGVLPLVFFRENFTIMNRDDFIYQVLPNSDQSLLKQAYLHDAPSELCPSCVKGESPRVVVSDQRSGRLQAHISAGTAGILVFSEIWAPSWRAYVDGIPTKVLRAYGMLQAIQLEAGDHEVLFEYDVFGSWQMKVAILGFLMAAVFIFVVIGRHFIRQRMANTRLKRQ